MTVPDRIDESSYNRDRTAPYTDDLDATFPFVNDTETVDEAKAVNEAASVDEAGTVSKAKPVSLSNSIIEAEGI